MAQDNKIRLPSSGAGITTYTDEYKSRFMFSPRGVMIIIGVVVVFVLLLHILA
jgi:preprotein translocase subunit Sec61beta